MKDNLIKSIFFSTIFYAIAYPAIQKNLIDAIDYKLIALNSIVICLFTIVIGHLWNNYQYLLYKYFIHFLIAETILYIISTFFAIIYKNLIGFYILDTLIMSTISKNIILGSNTLKAIKYNNKESRNRYDNDIQIYSSIATLLGSGICILIEMPLAISFIFMFLGVTIDNVFFGIEYIKLRSGDN